MDVRTGVFGFLGFARAVGLGAIALVALAGDPEPANADGLCWYVIDCHHSADDCVEQIREDCQSYQGCGDMEVFCRPSFEYPDCPNHEFIEVCEELPPT